MNFALRGAVLMSLLLVSELVLADPDPDPCNFNDGAIAYQWQQVMDCYNSVPFSHEDLEQSVAHISAARERADLREILQQLFGWRESIAALDIPGTEEDYPGDFAMQLAIVRNHKEFQNPHWRFRRATCYTERLSAFMPFDFGSDVMREKGSKKQQIFFIEDAPFLPDLYEAFTGIDARQYTGMKIISINGVEPGEYFRQWARADLSIDSNDGEQLNEVLSHAAYSLRISLTHDLPPGQAVDAYVLESPDGKRFNVEMPWIFAPRNTFGLWQIPGSYVSDTESFIETCNWKSDVYYLTRGFQGATATDPSAIAERHNAQSAVEEFTRELSERRDLAERLRHEYGGTGYFETPPGQRDQQLEIIVPRTDAAEVRQLGDRATIIHLDNFVGDWKEEVIAGTDYACANSDRLIFDLRGNNGGYITQIEWLTTHLFPERTQPRDYSLPGHFLASNQGRNELAVAMGQFSQDYYGGQCAIWYEAACWWNPVTAEPMTGLNWMTTNTVNELRGGVNETLSPMVSFANLDDKYAPGVDTIACPGKFADDTLVLLSDGTGASAGYFWLEIVRDRAVVVTMGGFVGEPLVTGIARGGAVWPMNDGEAWLEQYLSQIYGPSSQPLPFMDRWVETYIEQPVSYRSNLTERFIDQPSYGDLHIDSWSNSPGSHATTYRKVLSAVQKQRK